MKSLAPVFLILTITSADWTYHLNDGLLDGYFKLEEIYNDMDEVMMVFPDLVTVGNLGNSTGGIPIRYAQLKGTGIPDGDKGAALITSSQFAGYPANPSFVMYLLKRFATYYTTNSEERDVLWITNLYFVPVINVDAYKTMEDSYNGTFQVILKNSLDTNCSDSKQSGVNLDRNWGYNWGNTAYGSSDDPCDLEYRGKKEFSEIETQLISDFSKDKNIKVWLNYDSDGNYYVFPYTSAKGAIRYENTDIGTIYYSLGAALDYMNLTYGPALEIYGRIEDGTLIDYALSNGIFSLQGQISQGALYLQEPFSFFENDYQVAIWNIESASYYLDNFYVLTNLGNCTDFPEYCKYNSSLLTYNELHVTNLGLMDAKNILFEFNFSSSDPKYNFSVGYGWYTIEPITIHGDNYTYIEMDVNYINETFISASLKFDLPSMREFIYGFAIEGMQPSEDSTLNISISAYVNNANLPVQDYNYVFLTNSYQVYGAGQENSKESDSNEPNYRKGVIIGIIVGLCIIAVIIAIGLICYCRRRRQSNFMKQSYQQEVKESEPSKNFSPISLAIPPQRYAPSNII